jgi:tetratricopeptide (TPR) repeat protein
MRLSTEIVALPSDVERVELQACALRGRSGPFELLVHAGSPPEPRPSRREELERDHIEAALAAASELPNAVSADARVEALLAFELRYDSRAQSLYPSSGIVRMREERGPPDVRLADAVHLFGRLLFTPEEHESALPEFGRALAIDGALHGPDHPGNVSRLNDVDNQLQELGEYAAALPLAERALALQESVEGPDPPAVALRLDLLGPLLLKVGDPRALLGRAHPRRPDRGALAPGGRGPHRVRWVDSSRPGRSTGVHRRSPAPRSRPTRPTAPPPTGVRPSGSRTRAGSPSRAS